MIAARRIRNQPLYFTMHSALTISTPPHEGGFDWMWVWWGGTVALCLWKLIEAIVFRPVRMLEWPFLACVMWFYFFGYMAFKAKMTLSAYLGNGMSEIGQLMDFLCLAGLLAGWSVGKRIPVRAKPSTQIIRTCSAASLACSSSGSVPSETTPFPRP